METFARTRCPYVTSEETTHAEAVETSAQVARSDRPFGIATHDYLPFIMSLGFTVSDDDCDRYVFRRGDEVRIIVDINRDEIVRSSIDYVGVEVKHTGILSFKHEENLVTINAMVELYEKGYAPEHLTMEKTWKLGREVPGRLDILISKPNTKGDFISWAMVECKTWGEYTIEQNKMRRSGGQLLSYWLQDRAAEYLYLYTCRFTGSVVERKTDYVEVSTLNKNASNLEALHASWDKTFALDGIFHKAAQTYDSKERLRTKQDLKTLDKETGTGIFNAFAEVLRRYSVSDKGSAFNKIFNLFVCKLVDEDDHDDEDILDFQVAGSVKEDKLLDDLDRLYRNGLEKYLNIKVDTKYIAGVQNFAFVDVYDEQSFEENFRILKEVVRLLQPYKLKYSSKQQHLGDFFELLLNTGVKQEAGQFFTPVPLSRFVVKSLPLSRIVERSLTVGGTSLYPRVLDYACGSGHFITEAIDEVEHLLQAVDPATIRNRRDRDTFISQRSGYLWTKDYVYGIERDYRLAKVTKVATFLNGDGEATIIHADGLDDFSSSTTYRGLLRSTDPVQDHPVFDVLVANPPYSVPNFREGSPASSQSFSLLQHISYRGSEIECLFVERAAQVLRAGAVAAIILPTGFLTNEGVAYQEARKLLLRKFKLRAAVILGKNAFMATAISTVVLFLERRDDATWDAAVNDTETTSEALELLLKGEHTLITTTGDGQAEKSFLGYAFSSRRGSEGITPYDRCSLFPPVDGSSARYLSDFIQASFSDENVAELLKVEREAVGELDEDTQLDVSPIHEWSTFVTTNNLLKCEGEALRIDLTGNSEVGSNVLDFANVLHTTMGDLLSKGHVCIATGKRPSGGVDRIRSGALSLGGSHVDERTGTISAAEPKYVPVDFFKKYPSAHVEEKDVLLCKDGAKSGKVAFVATAPPSSAMVNEHVFRIQVTKSGAGQLDPEYLFCYLFSAEGREEMESAVGGSAQGGISRSRLASVRIPLPPLVEQRKKVTELRARGVEQGFPFSA